MSLCGARGGHTPLFSERCRLEPTHTNTLDRNRAQQQRHTGDQGEADFNLSLQNRIALPGCDASSLTDNDEWWVNYYWMVYFPPSSFSDTITIKVGLNVS